jgi:uridine kinase
MQRMDRDIMDNRFPLQGKTRKTISYNTKRGAEIYRRSLTILLQCAIEELYPELEFQIGQSLMKGYYFELPQDVHFPEHFTINVNGRMREIVEKDELFRREVLDRGEVIRLYKRKKRYDKVNALSYLKKKNIKLVFLKKYFDFLLAECVASTKYLKTFKLIRYKHGFILQFPEYGNLLKLPPDADRQEKLYEVHMERRKWGEILGIQNVSDLNDAIKTGRISTIVKMQEAFHEKKIGQIADKIKELYPRKKIIFVSGPSASGKTTFLKRLGIQIRANGLIPEEISLDDYFVPREKTPVLPDGTKDYESLEAIDVKFFNYQLERLMSGHEIILPKYSFKNGTREKSDRRLKLKEKSVVLVEGIHGLNPRLSEDIDDKKKYKIFVSALTQLCIDNDTRIFTSDCRLMRRINRDSMFRGYKARDTIDRFPLVRQGEDKYIFPFQDNADVFFNSAVIYEHAVLKPLIMPQLRAIKSDDKEYFEARRLLRYLDFVLPLSAEEVPQTSILREFIGESGFKY